MNSANSIKDNAEQKIKAKIDAHDPTATINAHNHDFGPTANHKMPVFTNTLFNVKKTHVTQNIKSGTWASNYYLYGEKLKKGADAKGYDNLYSQMKNDYRVAVERCHLWANAAGGPGESKNWVPMTRDANMTQRNDYENDYVKKLKDGEGKTKTVADLQKISTGQNIGNYQIVKYQHDPDIEKGEFDGKVDWEIGYLRWVTDNVGEGKLSLNAPIKGTVKSEITLRAVKNNTINSLENKSHDLENSLKNADEYGGSLENDIIELYKLTLDPSHSIVEENITRDIALTAIRKKLMNT